MRSSRVLMLAAAGIGAGVAVSSLLRNKGDDLRGQVVLITGGSRGLGLAMARAFAREGCRIVICAREAEELRNAQEDLESRGASVLAVECDVSDRDAVADMVRQAVERFGAVDVLVNNAGEIQVGPLETLDARDFEAAMRVMFWGVLYPTFAVLPQMTERGSGRIVNITSIGGKVAVPHLLPYTCAKFAAVGLSEGLRAELADKGVKVVTIAPGLMRTGSHQNAEFKGDHARENTWFSLGATLPGISMSADRAAARIVGATRRGDAEAILGAPASALANFHGVFPGVTANLLSLVDKYVLPSGGSHTRRRGHQVEGEHSRLFSLVTVLGRLAARRFLQPAKP